MQTDSHVLLPGVALRRQLQQPGAVITYKDSSNHPADSAVQACATTCTVQVLVTSARACMPCTRCTDYIK